MNHCQLKEPKVINTALLEKCIKEQGPKGEAGRLADIEEMPLNEVTQLRLEFMNILRIDHLWILPSLTKLNLNNNLIEKIENLDTLENLVELNLSFNKIAKIENMDELRNLEKLSLFDNKIEKLENMDNLTKLTVFSIGRNEIDDLENVLYLRRFSNLKCFNMVGNPCAETEDFRLFIATFLPQLVYYEYKLIYDMERELGEETFGPKLRALLESEALERETREQHEQEKAEAELHMSSFVEYLNTHHLFDSLFANDEDGKTLLKMGEDAKEFYDEYEENFLNLCKQIFENGQKQYLLRKEEHNQYLKCADDAKRRNQQESIQEMEIFMGKKALVFYNIKRLQDMLNSNDITYNEFIDRCDVQVLEFDEKLHEIWKALMKLELELYEQMDEVNQTFEHSMNELITSFVESSQAMFSQIRELEVTYSENMSDLALKFQTSAMGGEVEVPPILKPMMQDKDLLHNALSGSHDMHMQIIDAREDALMNNARDWLEGLLENLINDEIKRNRAKILEINHFLDIQREEFEELNAEYAAELDDVPEEEDED